MGTACLLPSEQANCGSGESAQPNGRVAVWPVPPLTDLGRASVNGASGLGSSTLLPGMWAGVK